MRQHLAAVTRALAVLFALSVWMLPVANAMQQQGGCCPSEAAHASAQTDCDDGDCCYAAVADCCDHDATQDPSSPDQPDVPHETDCDCDCCGVIVGSPPIAVALLPGGTLPADAPALLATTPTAEPDSIALGVSIQPPIV